MYQKIWILILLVIAPFSHGEDLWKKSPEEIMPHVEQIIVKAKNNDPETQYNLVTIYGRGIGVESNPDEADFWLLTAANNGHPQAQIWIKE